MLYNPFFLFSLYFYRLTNIPLMLISYMYTEIPISIYIYGNTLVLLIVS